VSRDYKPAPARERGSGKGSSFFSGLLVGLLLGVGISVGVAMFIKGGNSPFVAKSTQAAATPGASPDANAPPAAEKTGKDSATPGKPRFDFYTILPGSESQVTDQEVQQKESQPEAASSGENYFLQVGAFQTEQEADNMKAKLALLGMEAIVQTANIPDKGVWHRVRVGPFTELDQINKARAELARNGFEGNLIKISSNVPNQ
jgi:cell division protein FtsN